MGITPASSQGMEIGSFNKLPGTGQNVVADALIGFAKGYAEAAAKKREEEASNQRAVLQAMIQQEMVSPAMGGSAPDFKALGVGWQYGGTNKQAKDKAYLDNVQSEIASRTAETNRKNDPNTRLFEELQQAEADYARQVASGTRPFGGTDAEKAKRYSDFIEARKAQAVQSIQASNPGWVPYGGAQQQPTQTAGDPRGKLWEDTNSAANAASNNIDSMAAWVPKTSAPVTAPTSSVAPTKVVPPVGFDQNIQVAGNKAVTRQEIYNAIEQLKKKGMSQAQIYSELKNIGGIPEEYGVTNG